MYLLLHLNPFPPFHFIFSPYIIICSHPSFISKSPSNTPTLFHCFLRFSHLPFWWNLFSSNSSNLSSLCKNKLQNYEQVLVSWSPRKFPAWDFLHVNCGGQKPTCEASPPLYVSSLHVLYIIISFISYTIIIHYFEYYHFHFSSLAFQ